MAQINKYSPIAVTDSGIGGLSTLDWLCRLMPNEDFIYFGDSQNNPYGTKSTELVREIVFKNTQTLMSMGAKAIVVACNTATGAAVRALRNTYPDFTFVGIEPAIKPAALDKSSPTVAVMATPLTLSQDKFLRLAQKYADDCKVIPIACKGLADMIEGGDLEGEGLDLYLKDLFSDYDTHSIDSVVLGCTHYALIEDRIRAALPAHVKIFDGSLGVAKETQRQLSVKGLLSDSDKVGDVSVINTKISNEPLFKISTNDRDLVKSIISRYIQAKSI